jgi:hypothetical protein
MNKPKFKSDARPSDTKSVVLHKENDRRLLDHLKTTKRESEWWRAAGNFYLDFTEWLAGQEDAPQPNRPFIYYRAWLESRLSPSPLMGEGFDPTAVSQLLADVRQVVQAALDNARFAPLPPPAGGMGVEEVAELLDSLDALEVEEL